MDYSTTCEKCTKSAICIVYQTIKEKLPQRETYFGKSEKEAIEEVFHYVAEACSEYE